MGLLVRDVVEDSKVNAEAAYMRLRFNVRDAAKVTGVSPAEAERAWHDARKHSRHPEVKVRGGNGGK